MRELKIGGRYRHFKGREYIVLDIINDANSEGDNIRKLVIYEAQYGDHQKWARELNEFLSEIEPERQAQFQQKYRFEEID
ncbi:DUF1653 domain-containing protein [Ralstonia pseudosolanacearum]|uniref:DUF1653 domain-containing protein n=1 Tax=Ralstonia pseudosolanacearum TaxID=1310165 RepID=UPI003D162B93